MFGESICKCEVCGKTLQTNKDIVFDDNSQYLSTCRDCQKAIKDAAAQLKYVKEFISKIRK